uniref:Uncharacterized protein n=1 Tax=Globisporangium ultimum (strain ATCC 200006 / CBS 805.95 / DAOM BR144) TaxID=431595 RepID=K3WJ93_GLOUD
MKSTLKQESRQEPLTHIQTAKDSFHQLRASVEVVVAECIEAVIPFMYAIYLAIMIHLLNTQNYEDLRDITEQQVNTVIVNILIYTGLELLSMVYVYVMIKRSFGVPVLYQLTFAPENKW